jgi:hypothetical protein
METIALRAISASAQSLPLCILTHIDSNKQKISEKEKLSMANRRNWEQERKKYKAQFFSSFYL